MTTRDFLPTDDRFDEIKQRILGTIDLDDRRRTRKHRLIALGVAGALVAGTTAGAIAIAQAPQGQINYTADCYAAADLGSRHGTSQYLPGDQDAKTPTPLDQRIALAEEMC